MCRIFNDYLELAKRHTVIIDVVLAALISGGITLFITLQNVSEKDTMTKIADLTKVIIPTFAIQAGFHGTSLSIFSSSSTGMAKYLKETRIENTNRRLIEQIYAYFSWAVVVQVLLLFYAMVLYYVVSYLPSGFLGSNIQWHLSAGLIGGVLYALLLTLRNVGILYYFLIASARRFGEE